jgi:hypothetical protein
VQGVSHTVLSAVINYFGRFAVRDWVLLAIGGLAIAWLWTRQVALARLGPVTVAVLNADGDKLAPAQVKAELENCLSTRGALPPSAVPSGMPTIAAISTALTAALPQAPAVGALLDALPLPSTSTSFSINGTLLTGASSEPYPCGLSYEVACTTGPRSVNVNTIWAANWTAVSQAAAHAIYGDMQAAAPGLYPTWGRWNSERAYDFYARGVAGQDRDRAAALRCFRAAQQQDADNMLAALRVGNCYERMALESTGDERLQRRLFAAALTQYVNIRVREPTIFEAGYRASLVMSTLASLQPAAIPAFCRDAVGEEIDAAVGALENMPTKPVDRLLLINMRELIRKVSTRRSQRASPTTANGSPEYLKGRLTEYAQREMLLARRRTKPLWTVLYENRFRHLFEPQGRSRRQLRKALGVSHMCRHAREAALRRPRPTDAQQFLWRGWVFWRYMFGRWAIAGWQAHYNAACFYSLLPNASQNGQALGERRITARALRHLSRALAQAGNELPISYVRADADLAWLRQQNEFNSTIEPIWLKTATVVSKPAPRMLLVVHYQRLQTVGQWGLYVWGDSLLPSDSDWDSPLKPTDEGSDTSLTFIIEITNPAGTLNILPHCGEQKDIERTLTPAETSGEIWLTLGNAAILDAAPDEASSSASP